MPTEHLSRLHDIDYIQRWESLTGKSKCFANVGDRSCGIKAENFLLSEYETRTTYIGREVDIYVKSPTPSLTKRINIPIPSLTKRINIITYNR